MTLIELHKTLNRTLVLDGAMGSLLEMMGLAKRDRLWSARCNFECPDVVEQIHCHYVKNGADIIRTNTFRTNPVALKEHELSSKELVTKAVKLARSAVEKYNVSIAGSNPPAEDCYQIERTISHYELRNNHETHLNNLNDSGVDVLWNETFSHLDEIKIVSEYCDSLNTEYVINLFVNSNLHLLSGEYFLEAIEYISKYNPTAIGFNCISLNVFEKLMDELNPEYNFGFYLNCGLSPVNVEQFDKIIPVTNYAASIIKFIKYNPLFIGSCCGSNPLHTKSIKELLS